MNPTVLKLAPTRVRVVTDRVPHLRGWVVPDACRVTLPVGDARAVDANPSTP
jgi:hypothetical protein